MVRRNGEKGQALIFVAVGMVVLLAFMALSIDVGYMRYLRRELQTAADAAAISAAAELNYFGTSGNYTCAAQYDASNNGFTQSGSSCALPGPETDDVTVTVTLNTSLTGCNSAPPSVPPSVPPTCVQVTIQDTAPLFFAGIFTSTPPTISATAVAYWVSGAGNVRNNGVLIQ